MEFAARPGPLALVELVGTAAAETFGNELRCVVIKGSAVEHGGRDFIPYFSDVDCSIYLASAAMRGPVTPRTDLALDLRARLGKVRAEDYEAGSWSAAFWDEHRLHDWALQPLADGQYRVITGELPATFRNGTPAEYLDRSAKMVAAMGETADRAVRYCADVPDERLADQLRAIAPWVKSGLRSAVTVAARDAFVGWTTPLAAVLSFVEPSIVPSGAARRFYHDLSDWRAVRRDPKRLAALVADAATILDEMRAYFALTSPETAER